MVVFFGVARFAVGVGAFWGAVVTQCSSSVFDSWPKHAKVYCMGWSCVCIVGAALWVFLVFCCRCANSWSMCGCEVFAVSVCCYRSSERSVVRVWVVVVRDFLADHLVDMSRGFGWPERGRSARKRVFVDFLNENANGLEYVERVRPPRDLPETSFQKIWGRSVGRGQNSVAPSFRLRGRDRLEVCIEGGGATIQISFWLGASCVTSLVRRFLGDAVGFLDVR